MWFFRLSKGSGEGVCNCVGMNFKVSHIFREDNNSVDKLANLSVDNKLDIFLELCYVSLS